MSYVLSVLSETDIGKQMVSLCYMNGKRWFRLENMSAMGEKAR